VPAGTVLKGLNFYKDKQDPVAMADEEYPAWLWKVLDKTSGDAVGAKVDEGDLYGTFFCFSFHGFFRYFVRVTEKSTEFVLFRFS